MNPQALRAIIVDDEPAGRRTLREYAEQHGGIDVLAEFGDARSALEALPRLAPELLFLDIQMAGMTGVELVRALPPTTRPGVVFVTAYDRFAVEAFELHAVDYLLKPFDEARFTDAVQRARARRDSAHPGTSGTEAAASPDLEALLDRLAARIADRESRPPGMILAESGSSMRLLDPADVQLVESDRNYVKLLAGREGFFARGTLQHAEAALARQPMLRISRSLLVNLRHVREVSRTPRGDFILVMAGGQTVTSSEGQRENVREALERLRPGRA